MLNQIDIENKYSRKAIRKMVKDDVDVTSDVYKACVDAVQDYLLKVYYKSKDERISKLHCASITVDEIVLELFASILPNQVLTPIQSIAANLGSRLGYKYLLDSIRTAAEIIAVCEKSGLYTIYHSSHQENDTDTLAVLAHYKLSQKVIDYIDGTMFMPPMVCKPKNWVNKNNTGGGYISENGSCILGAINHHNLPLNLGFLNTLQSIAWEFNHHILALGEKPNKPLETKEQELQFEQFKREAIEVRKLLIDCGNRFFFQYRFDSGGRSYSSGYHVNLQSTEFQKASIQFKHKEAITL